MHKIICNTTPILSLIKINKLEILQQIYHQITIPLAVYNEIEDGKSKLHYINLKSLNWIIIEEIEDRESMLNLSLDAGEGEVIQLALERKADLVILDENAGRAKAIQNKLKITGTIGILLKAKELGYINPLRNELDTLINQGIWLSKKLYNTTLELANEL